MTLTNEDLKRSRDLLTRARIRILEIRNRDMSDSAEIDTSNVFMVGMKGDDIVIMRWSKQITTEEALNLAASIVSLADPCDERFPKILEAIRNT